MEIDVRHVAMLARIAITPEEEAKLKPQLARILDYVRKLDELDVSGVEPTAHPHDFSSPLRADLVTNTNQREALLACAPEVEDGLFVVPKVIE
ncbi:MAG: Asp-tRNA(Asn)/Glu-tRNA(Gln) amidotransferase GatCAB subunit C [Zetaproteobacteria bacterium]|nr:MAG: Asp-tRNA(Asn)/Glu-tRNA(Gln) amidotransferase GatCAB subunit C [Zetaproteobacteria bacterium]